MILLPCAVPECRSIQHPRDAGEWGHDGGSSSCPFKKGSGDGDFIRSTWNKFIALFGTSIKCRTVFYNFCYNILCQHSCWTETSIIGNIFFQVFFALISFTAAPCSTVVPASLKHPLRTYSSTVNNHVLKHNTNFW